MKIQRLEYIDVMKGILIFFVVLLHLPWVATMLCNYDCNIFELSKYHTQFIGVYYMAGFFFVTGYCTNFDKERNIYITNNVKILLIPAMIFSFLDMVKIGNVDLIGLFFYGGTFWFLPALFWTKGIYFFLRKYFHGKTLFLIVTALSALGFLLHDYGVKNFWSFEHGLAFLPAIFIGEYARYNGKRIYEYASILIFITIYIVCCILDINIPVLARTFKPVLSQMPLFLILSFTGCFMVLCLAKYISSHCNTFMKSLVFWGKNSLLIYLLSNTVMEFMLKFSMFMVPDMYQQYNQYLIFNVTVYFTVVALTMISFVFIVKLFHLKWLSWTLGKI